MVGDIEVNTISDGTFTMDVSKLLSNIKPKELDSALKKNFLTKDVESSVDTFLINTGTKLVLVDTGMGPFMPTTGHLIEHMKAAGYNPDQVDAVVITHMHGDHIGGLVTDGKRVFKNATLYIDKAELDFWLDSKNAEKATSEMMKKMFELAPKVVEPYKAASKLTPINGDMEIVPGLSAHATHGHTPGHQTYIVESNGSKLMLLGDMIHVASVQFEKPTARMGFDNDPEKAEKIRLETFKRAAKENLLLAAAHLPFPGVGHVREEKGGYVFVPLNYTR